MFDSREAEAIQPEAPAGVPSLDVAMVDAMSVAARTAAVAEAGVLAAVAGLAMLRRAEAADRTVRLDRESVERFIADEVAVTLHLSPVVALQRVALADSLVTGAPATFAALAAGQIDLARARRIAEGVAVLSRADAAQVEAAVLARATDQTASQVAAAVRRAVITADPAAASRAYARAKEARHARIQAEDDGMASIWVTGTADQVSVAWQTATAVAQHRVDTRPDEHLTLGQARADAILDLLRSPNGLPDGELPPIDVHVRVIVPAFTVAESEESRAAGSGAPGPHGRPSDRPAEGVHLDEGPAEGAREAPAEFNGPGVRGPVSPAFLADLLGGTHPLGDSTSGPDVTFTRWITDPRGVVTATSSRKYRPPPSLDAAIRARDLACRFPGCAVRAERCDLDHTNPHPTGPTSTGNLAALCRRHHRLKTHTRWRLRQYDHGALEWTTPTGHTYRTDPPTWAVPFARPAPGQPTQPRAYGDHADPADQPPF